MFVGPEFLRSTDIPPVIIIGSGPAGLTLALSLAERRIPCLIIEAGDFDFQPEKQDDFIGQVTGDAYFDLDVSRLRQFGGSSNHWGGYCRPLDSWDFDGVPDLDIPEWPIGKSDLDPYSQGANEILEIEDTVDYPLNDDIFEAQFVFSPPVNFSHKYEANIRNSQFIHVALNTPTISISAEDGRIDRLNIVDANGDALTLSPQFVVVACGGIENSRLLLWSNEVSLQRVVADPAALGRYWMEHPHEDVGLALVKEEIFQHHIDLRQFSVGISPERLLEHGALNAAVRLKEVTTNSLKERVRIGLCEISPDFLELANTAIGTDGVCGKDVKVVWEQAPDIDNRVALSQDARDSFNVPRPHLYWRKTEQDYRTARVAFELVGSYLVRSGNGIAKAYPHLIEMGNYPEESEIAGHHHLGGTRMSESAETGVVDENLKIHGISNGYVAGSSVFVRGGHANPTFTIVQLSLRLADHLSSQISG